jgi:hypothetical protein
MKPIMATGNLDEFEVPSGNEASSAATGTTTTTDEVLVRVWKDSVYWNFSYACLVLPT